MTATGLPVGNYLVAFRTRIYPEQRYECAIAHGSLGGSVDLVTYRTTNSGGNPETIESTGVLTIHQANQNQIFYCNGFTADWSASNSEVHFIKIDSVIEGVEG